MGHLKGLQLVVLRLHGMQREESIEIETKEGNDSRDEQEEQQEVRAVHDTFSI